MPQVHDIGTRFFTHTMQYPTRRFPLIDLGNTQEIEDPYRFGRSVVVRLPLSRRAFVLGKWSGTRNERSALSGAIGMREIDVAEGDYSQYYEPQDPVSGAAPG